MLKYAVVGLGRVGYEMFSRMYEYSQTNKNEFEVIGIDTSLLRVQELLKKHPGCISKTTSDSMIAVRFLCVFQHLSMTMFLTCHLSKSI